MASKDTIKKGDFIEINFVARLTQEHGGGVFDANSVEELKKAGLPHDAQSGKMTKPFIFCVGHKMFLEGIDEYLIGKEVPKEYQIMLAPDKAFGQRNTAMVKVMPMTQFRQQNILPQPGMSFNFDGQIAKVLSVSGGRVIVDFNNPLAGKDVIYDVDVLRKVDKKKEQVDAVIDFLFRRTFPYDLDEKKKTLLVKLKGADAQFAQFMDLFKDKFKELLDLELSVESEGAIGPVESTQKPAKKSAKKTTKKTAKKTTKKATKKK